MRTVTATIPVPFERPTGRTALARERSDCSGPPAAYLWLKAAIEPLLAGCALVAISPLIFLLAVSLKATSRGPAFYVSTRLGRRGRPFRMYGFRTTLHEPDPGAGGTEVPRLTRLGRFILRTGLSPLPQLWNVVRGEMAFIGPAAQRPELTAALEQHLMEFGERLRVRPGMTGWAQLSLPAPRDWHGVQAHAEHDLRYVRHAGPLLDLRIALSAALKALSKACSKAGDAIVRRDRIEAWCGAPPFPTAGAAVAR